MLAALQRAGAMVPLAFQGGTALRFLYSIRRHSEDLGFALERPGAGYDLRGYLEAVRGDLRREGYSVELARVSDERVVHSAFVRFPGLLHELGLSGQREQALSVKIEVDSRPPAGATLATTVLNNALAQTGWAEGTLTPASWTAAVRKRLASVRWDALVADVAPLLESAEDAALLTRETVEGLLGRHESSGDERPRHRPPRA